MLGIGVGVGIGAMVSPEALQRMFGVPRSQVTAAGALGWRLFAARNLYLGARALRGDRQAVAAYGHLQVIDQAVFWSALSSGRIPRRTSVLAILTSGAVVALDRHRRSA